MGHHAFYYHHQILLHKTNINLKFYIEVTLSLPHGNLQLGNGMVQGCARRTVWIKWFFCQHNNIRIPSKYTRYKWCFGPSGGGGGNLFFIVKYRLSSQYIEKAKWILWVLIHFCASVYLTYWKKSLIEFMYNLRLSVYIDTILITDVSYS